jgi:pilus assembly protein CpaE
MAKTNTDLPHNFMGFLNDPVSQHIVEGTIREMGMAYAEVVQGGVEAAIDFLKNNRTPKVIIVDISNSELPLSDIMKINEYSTPNLKIIVTGSRNDVGLFRDLMNAGISDYIVKPLSNQLVRKAIDDANSGIKIAANKTGKLIQVISSVGGAGATTLVTNVGWLLANNHFKRAVVMDLDFLFGTSHLMLDIKAENSYTDILESPDKIDDYFVETILRKHGSRLYYLGGLADLMRGLSMEIAAFEAIVSLVKKQFNYVLVDSQRDISPHAKVMMHNADCFVIMIEMSIASAQNAARLLEFLNSDQAGKKVLMVANKVGLSSGGALSKDSFEKVINRKIDYAIPLEESMTLAAANVGQPLAASNNPLSDIFDDITNDLLEKNEAKQIVEELLKKEGFTMELVKAKALELFEQVFKAIKKK